MRLTTIWTLRGMPLRERLHRTRVWGSMQVAARLPESVRYWVFIMEGARAMGPDEVVPDVRYMDLLKRMTPAGD